MLSKNNQTERISMRIKTLLFSALVLLSCSTPRLAEHAFFVSPLGNDEWSGRSASTNGDKTDGPFLTLERARQAVRDFIAADGIPAGGVTVYLRGGEYRLERSLLFEEADSGTPASPILWRSFPKESARITGAKPLAGFEAVADSAILQRLSPSARQYVVQADLRRQGITETGQLLPLGFGRAEQPIESELIIDGKAMTLARYPNEGWLQIESVPQTGAKLLNPGNKYELFNNIPAGRHYGRFITPDRRCSRWQMPADIWMHGYWTWDWADTHERVAAIDTVNRAIYPAEQVKNYGYRQGQRFYFRNILEELDSPGEWYLDRATGIAYVWPPNAVVENSAYLTLLDQPMIRFENTEHLQIIGLSFENSRARAIDIQGGQGIVMAGCTFQNLGNDAVLITGGFEHRIASCDFHSLAAGGIRADAGVRATLQPGNVVIENNHLHDYGRLFRTYHPAIHITGVGNRVAHNTIHDAPHMGLYFGGNDLILEYNEVHSLARETGDVGAFYIGRDWTQRGNIVRYNYFHHLHGPGLHGVNSVYLDDFASDHLIFGNIFYKVDRGAFIGGGRDNVIENNLFIECTPSVHVDSRGLGWASRIFDGTDLVLFNRMDAMNFRQPPYSERYPELLTLYDDQPARAKHNIIRRNVSLQGRWMDIYDGLTAQDLTITDNLIVDAAPSRWSPLDDHLTTDNDRTFFQFDDDKMPAGFHKELNQTASGAVGVIQDTRGRFKLESDSPAFDLGFEPIPIDKIGLYVDEYRRRLPEPGPIAGQ